MKTHKFLAGILFATAATTGGAAIAADTGYYLGFSAGQARPRFDSAPASAAGFPITNDSSDSAWKVFAGYQFNQYFGVEGNYVKFGTYNSNLNFAGTPLFTDININGWGLALTGTLPLGKTFSLFGRAGETYTRESLGTCSRICGGTAPFSASNTWSPTAGVGLKYDFHPNWFARAEVERYFKVGSSDTTIGASINLYTIGLAYKF
jgi:OOP family OmpA-OmpF porin